MGGIVARHSITQLADPTLVTTVVSLSSPHFLPPLAISPSISAIYDDIGRFFSPHNLVDSSHPASQTLLMSLCGGSPDPTLASDACALPSDVVPATHGLSIFTSGMVGTWTGVDHEAMVWCHQVRWRVARTLLEIASLDTKVGREERLSIGRKWLLGTGADLSRTPTPPLVVVNLPLQGVRSGDRFASSSPRHFSYQLSGSGGAKQRFTLLSTYAIDGVGAQNAPPASILHCDEAASPLASRLACRPLKAKRVELLPPSPVDGSPFKVGDGVDEKEGLVWLETDPIDGTGSVIVAVEGQGWGIGEFVPAIERPTKDMASMLC
jgi:hypothetical protein